MPAGSELYMAVEAAKELEGMGKKARVVSLMSWELFESQGQQYKDSVILPDVEARVSMEAGCTFGWSRYIGPKVQLWPAVRTVCLCLQACLL